MAYYAWIEFKRPALVPNQQYLEVMGFSPRVSPGVALLPKGAAGSGKPTANLIECMREGGDQASHRLLHATHTGQSFAEVIIGARDGSASGKLILQYTLVVVTITRYESDPGPHPLTGKMIETFDLSFSDLKVGKV